VAAERVDGLRRLLRVGERTDLAKPPGHEPTAEVALPTGFGVQVGQGRVGRRGGDQRALQARGATSA
jgi:hypothetical protein